MRVVLALLLLAAASAPARGEPDFCADPSATCAAKLPQNCLRKFSAGSLAAGDACDGPMLAYKTCLSDAAE
ncbi:MAG: hypothetical protein AAFW46_16550, partial [Pseudomonadota bacterium]